MTEVVVNPECPFSLKSFELFEELENNSQKRNFYLKHQEDFKKYIEQPFQHLYQLTYHDAIQDQEGRQVVNYAAIIYPGSYASYSKTEIEALPAYPGAEVMLQEHLRRVLGKALELS